MRVNLNWTSRVKKSGFFRTSKSTAEVDLDLGCLYELADGKKGVVQALGKKFGSRSQPPYIELDGDDRSGANADGENLFINLEHPERFKRILIFAMIYQGADSFSAVDGVVTMYPTQPADRSATRLTRRCSPDLRYRTADIHQFWILCPARGPLYQRCSVRAGHGVRWGGITWKPGHK